VHIAALAAYSWCSHLTCSPIFFRGFRTRFDARRGDFPAVTQGEAAEGAGEGLDRSDVDNSARMDARLRLDDLVQPGEGERAVDAAGLLQFGRLLLLEGRHPPVRASGRRPLSSSSSIRRCAGRFPSIGGRSTRLPH
jgi:hypothetical protein